jgi:hypothetical protein
MITGVDEPGDVGLDRPTGSDAQVLAGLRGRRRWGLGVLGLSWAALAVGQLAQGNGVLGAFQALLALAWAWLWWSSPEPHVRSVTDDALVLRRGARTESVPRSKLRDVQPKHLGSYGLLLTFQDGEPVALSSTAPRFSVAAAQAAALRRWAGLDEPVS